jgi:two-component system, OmpR family, sensor histidine kinase VicK
MSQTTSHGGGWADGQELGRLAYRSPDPLMTLNDQGIILAVNPAWRDVLGWEPEDLLGRPFFDFIHDDDRPHTSRRWQTVVAGETVIDERNRWSTADGGWCWLSWSWKHHEATGHVFSAGRDVTAHMETHLRITEDRQLLATAEALAEVGSWEWTGPPDLVSMSEQMREHLGIADPGPVTADRALEALHDDDRHRIRELLRMALERQESFDTEFRVVGLHGVRSMTMHVEPTRDPDGAPRLYGAVQDVTEQRRLDDLKDAFLAAASHELRTPLSVIRGTAETLARLQASDAVQRRRLEEALVRNVDRLEHLMTDLLDFSTLEHQGLRLRPSQFDVATLVHQLVAATPIAARVTIDGPCSLVVDADAALVERILLNLLENAAKYAMTSPVTVSYRQQHDVLRLSVADAGPGVPAADTERIFQPFHRVTEDRPQPGTGIGLALVAEYAQAHGGRAWLETHEPGAEFLVELRLAPGKRRAPEHDHLGSPART